MAKGLVDFLDKYGDQDFLIRGMFTVILSGVDGGFFDTKSPRNGNAKTLAEYGLIAWCDDLNRYEVTEDGRLYLSLQKL